MTTLITGVGAVGSHLAAKLQEMGERVELRRADVRVATEIPLPVEARRGQLFFRSLSQQGPNLIYGPEQYR